MSDEDDQLTSEVSEQTQHPYLTAEYKDGRLQIVEFSPYEVEKDNCILPEVQSETEGEQTKYMQVLDKDGLMQLDLLNLTLVKCEDGEEAYRLVANPDAGGGEASGLTCVLQPAQDNEDQDEEGQESYVMIEGSDEPVPVLLQGGSRDPQTHVKEEIKNENLSAVEILQRAKAIKKARAILSSVVPARKRGRRRKAELLAPHELMASPNFKLHLYNCKLCPFKCNAIKELQAHRAAAHGPGKARGAAGWKQCARCPFRANSRAVTLHVESVHGAEAETETETITITSCDKQSLAAAAGAADVLVCGACGFESPSRGAFAAHVLRRHSRPA